MFSKTGAAKMCEHSSGWRPEDGVPDLAMMSDITDHCINVNLRARYLRNEIYTFSGSILIAINPYKPLNIYNDTWIAKYRNKPFDQTDPHVFALSEAMYMSLVMQDYSPVASAALSQADDHHYKTPNTSANNNNATQHSSSTLSTQASAHHIGNRNQVCVISGESGAGKTETTKFILSYLCSVTPNKSSWMEHQILEANTILEAFGNAKTVRNDNSSRFGKFIQISFDTHYQINGCIIQDYLLEQSRITYQSTGERNYHVFYQLLSAGQTNEELRQKFHLMPVENYEYLNKTQCYKIETVDDCAMFDTLRMAMSVLNMDQENCDGIFSVLSAILWLGNIQFKCDEGGSQGSDEEECNLTDSDKNVLSVVAKLLGISQQQLEPITLKRQINVCGTITEIPLKVNEARDNRNGMAKALYMRLFRWIVNFINASTNPGQKNNSFLGVLDIFGFENFDTNSFEQLCINYANEKLHKFFNHHMFAMEQELYFREGLEFCTFNYTDNTLCLELLEKPPSCILRLLSEECRMPKGSDLTFIEKLHSEFSSTHNPHPFYISDKRNRTSEFCVRHFAGPVTYKVEGFLKKNKDVQQNQLLEIMVNSSKNLLRELAENQSSANNSCAQKADIARRGSYIESLRNNSFDFVSSSLINSSSIDSCSRRDISLRSQLSLGGAQTKALIKGRRESFHDHTTAQTKQGLNSSTSYTNQSSKTRPTVADTFRHQLTSLVDLLNSANPWYVRCIKTNLEKSAHEYDDQQVLMQLKYLGMSDLIKIRREGHPIHLTKHQFVCRYRCLLQKYLRLTPQALPINLDDAKLDQTCTRMMKYFELDSRDWKIGKTMVFLRSNLYQPLEAMRNALFVKMAILVQKMWRGYVAKKEFRKIRSAIIQIQESFRAYRGRLLYLRKKRAVLTIQAYTRGMFAREISNALREIKRAEIENARKLAFENEEKERLLKQQQQQKLDDLKRKEEAESSAHQQAAELAQCQSNGNGLEVRRKADDEFSDGDARSVKYESNLNDTPKSHSPAVSLSNSWVGQDAVGKSKDISTSRDENEMKELVQVLERHGISIDALERNGENIYADLEKFYDVLGNHQPLQSDNQSISPSVNEDDRSIITVGTTCDADTVSCSGQSQISSTVIEENNNEQTVSSNGGDRNSQSTFGNQDDDVNSVDSSNRNQEDDAVLSLEENQYQSNSIESIASIVSASSTNYQQQQQQQPVAHQNVSEIEVSNHPKAYSLESSLANTDYSSRASTFTGAAPALPMISRLVANGRALTRIEEEPNSTATSPSKTPYRRRVDSNAKSEGLFPPESRSETSELEQTRLNQCAEIKRRRLERRIIQVQQEKQQIEPPYNNQEPDTLNEPHSSNNRANKTDDENTNDVQENEDPSQVLTKPLQADQENESSQKQNCNINEFAETMFNNHPREIHNPSGVIRTLTRRKKSIDTNSNIDYLGKLEMLSYNVSFTIPTSHIKMYCPHNAQISCTLFKNLCKFMSTENMKFENEVRIVQSIVRNGIEKTELRDEIYVQIVRQLTNNPNDDHCKRLWTLLGLVSSAFPPSKVFSKYLIAHLKDKPRKDPSITCHAQFVLDNLQAPRTHPRKYPPSPTEIQACKSLTNLTCKVDLLDGRQETLSVHPCDTAFDTLTKLAQKINLLSIEGWALYETAVVASKTSGNLKKDYERSIRSYHFMADLMASWYSSSTNITNLSSKSVSKQLTENSFKLTLKKRLFRGPKIRNDPVEISLLYCQAVFNIVKKDSFLVDENLAVGLAGVQAQIMYGNAADLGKNNSDSKKQKNSKNSVVSYKKLAQLYEPEFFICSRLRRQTTKSKKEWISLISQSHRRYHGVNDILCKVRYLSMVIYHCPLYGTAIYPVTYKGYQTMGQNLLLGINAEGVVIIRSEDRALVSAHRYTDIEQRITVYADENIIQMNVNDRTENNTKCLSFESIESESEEIAMLMVSYSTHHCINLRGASSNSSSNITLDPSFDQEVFKRKVKLKMTLEDRMRIHQDIQNARRTIILSSKLRKPCGEAPTNLFRHTLKKLSTNKTRFENIYGTIKKSHTQGQVDIPQTSSDYSIYGSAHAHPQTIDHNQAPTDVAGATAATTVDEVTKSYPHNFWAYTRYPLKNSLLTIYDPDLEEAALANFNSILTYSGLINHLSSNELISANFNPLVDSTSTDSGIASQQSNPCRKPGTGSPSSGEIYDVCPKKLDEKDLLKLAQEILDRCLKKGADILKNEFFLQLIKQTTDHPDPNSEINKRHWQLLALACSITYPSDTKILTYLNAHLRRCCLDQVTDEGQYARFTLRNLQGTLDTKGRRFTPSDTEVLSTINFRRVYARVYFLDGQFQTVEFDPCATIAEVIDQIKQKIGLKPKRNGYALFQPLDDECEQVLHPDEKVGDAISAWESWHKQRQANFDQQIQLQQQASQQQHNSTGQINSIYKPSLATLSIETRRRTHRFVFKKYLFIDSQIDLEDPVERELIYYQTVTSIRDNKFPILDQEAPILCALKAQIEIGDCGKLSNLTKEQSKMVYKQVVMSLMPPHAYNSVPVLAVAQQHQALRELSSSDSKKYFFNLIQSFGRASCNNVPSQVQLHLAHVYEATQTFITAWPSDIWLVINQTGLHMLISKSRRVLTSIEYRTIIDYNANSNYLVVMALSSNALGKAKYTFYTKQAVEIDQQMKDYIKAVNFDGTKQRKCVEFNISQQVAKQQNTNNSTTISNSNNNRQNQPVYRTNIPPRQLML